MVQWIAACTADGSTMAEDAATIPSDFGAVFTLLPRIAQETMWLAEDAAILPQTCRQRYPRHQSESILHHRLRCHPLHRRRA